MKRLTKGILAGLCAVVGGWAVSAAVLPAQTDVPTAQAEATYTTKDVAMMAYIDNVYAPNGNFYLYVTLSEMDTTTEAEAVAYDTTVDDMPTMFNNFDFFNKVKINGYTLAELGCTGVWENAFDVNAGGGAPKFKFRFHMHADPTKWNEAINAGKFKGFAMDVKCFFGTVTSVLKSDGVVEGGTGAMKKEETEEQKEVVRP